MATFKIRVGGREVALSATRQGEEFRVVHGGESYRLRLVEQSANTFVLEHLRTDGTRRLIHVATTVAGDRRQLWANGEVVQYERVRKRAESAARSDASLAASIPAVVSEVLVAAGDAVSEGEKLVLLESMKMVIPISAPYSGRITAVNCAVGDSVQAGVQLVELEAQESK